ncbi:MAG TPA: SOS response-associated peptidase [Anaerolineales bacterium]|nr:SOS response-associated peptidase [Anaerolineales bacterium]
MCGRFTLSLNAEDLQATFPEIELPPQYAPRYNIAPSQPVAAIALNALGKPVLQHFLWGLVPTWAKDISIANKLINARAETLHEKPSFRTAFKKRRCLVLADGFYEWKSQPKVKDKTPMYIQMSDGSPFTMGGLWESWKSPEGDQLLTCTLITTTPNELMADIHNRMPVIIPAERRADWLSPTSTSLTLEPLLTPYPAHAMQAYAVSSYVNSPFNEGARCVLRES